MAASVLFLILLIHSLVSPSDANFCVCNSGQSDALLQKNIDYACGHGADCSAIQPNGACYNPNTVKDHCSYAVNSYYQKKGQTADSCNFQGTAAVTPTAPSGGSGCVFQSNPSTGGATPAPPGTGGAATPPTIGGTTPTPPSTGGAIAPPTSPAIGGAPTAPSTGGTASPTSSPGFGGTPGTGGGTSTPGVFPGTGTGVPTAASPFGSTDGSTSVKLSSSSCTTMALAALTIVLVVYGFIHPRM